MASLVSGGTDPGSRSPQLTPLGLWPSTPGKGCTLIDGMRVAGRGGNQ